ncbi:long-chain fatty acid--CoA ligase [Streptomyces sp. NPDC058299]|uniref:long-chain-fatty-acid--CoA ligase n=1 Tax=Streptomyces sp. NPDC058299 TaxID=3346435 RepID=UPI0036E0B9DC
MTSLSAVLRDSAARRPDHPALIWQDSRISYRELWERCLRTAGALRRHGIGRGDRVAVLLPNGPDFPVVYFAVLALGAAVVPVHTLFSRDEVEYILRDSGARALVCLPERAEWFRSTVACLTARQLADGVPVTEVDCAGDEIALVLYTSGTTGRPKGVMLSHAGVLGNIDTTLVSPFAFTGDDVLYGCLPLSHTFGQICGMGVTLRAGATLVLVERFEATAALRDMSAHGCTVLMGVPTMYRALLDADAPGLPMPRLNRAYCGGASLPVRTLREFTARFGCEVYEGYGLTETSPVVAYNHPGEAPAAGTVGRPIDGVEVRIADLRVEDSVERLPEGRIGEVLVRGPGVMRGYLGLPEETGQAVVDGWFRTGDLGRIDDDGRLVLVDRKKDMLIRGGYNVYPREVEEVLVHHPHVAQVAVVGVPDDRLGQEVCAVVVPRTGVRPDAGDITAWARERLAAYKYPRRVEFVDHLPLGASGKVLKRALVTRLTTG